MKRKIRSLLAMVVCVALLLGMQTMLGFANDQEQIIRLTYGTDGNGQIVGHMLRGDADENGQVDSADEQAIDDFNALNITYIDLEAADVQNHVGEYADSNSAELISMMNDWNPNLNNEYDSHFDYRVKDKPNDGYRVLKVVVTANGVDYEINAPGKGGSATVGNYTVTVDGDGQATLTGLSRNTNHVQFYHVKPEATTNQSIEKIIEGDVPAEKSTFEFTLKAENANNPMPEDANAGEKKISIEGEGTNSFGDMVFTQTGTYTYTISEENGGISGYEYSTDVYTLKVNVAENSDGDFEISKNIYLGDEEMSGVVFKNVYSNISKPDNEEGKADINITKSVDKEQAKPGDILTYSIKVKNQGDATAENITVLDYAPVNTVFVSSENGKYTVVDGREAVKWEIKSLKPNESKTLVFKVRIKECQTGTKIKNVAIWGNDEGLDSTSNEVETKVVGGTELTPRTGDISNNVLYMWVLVITSVTVAGATLALKRR